MTKSSMQKVTTQERRATRDAQEAKVQQAIAILKDPVENQRHGDVILARMQEFVDLNWDGDLERARAERTTDPIFRAVCRSNEVDRKTVQNHLRVYLQKGVIPDDVLDKLDLGKRMLLIGLNDHEDLVSAANLMAAELMTYGDCVKVVRSVKARTQAEVEVVPAVLKAVRATVKLWNPLVSDGHLPVGDLTREQRAEVAQMHEFVRLIQQLSENALDSDVPDPNLPLRVSTSKKKRVHAVGAAASALESAFQHSPEPVVLVSVAECHELTDLPRPESVGADVGGHGTPQQATLADQVVTANSEFSPADAHVVVERAQTPEAQNPVPARPYQLRHIKLCGKKLTLRENHGRDTDGANP